MVEWQSPETVEICAFIFERMIVFVLGMYLWYFVLTLQDVEWGLLTRRLQLSVVTINYLIGRYCLLTTLIMLFAMNQLDELMKVVCDTSGSHSVTALAVLGNMALVSASTNLQLRAVALWKGHTPARTLLIALCLAHWAFCLELGIQGFGLVYEPALGACTIDFGTAHRELLAFYLYTVLWDAAILAFTVGALRAQHAARGAPLGRALRVQGVGYLVVTCVTNVPMTAMAWLNLNYIMMIFFILPGNTISVMASSAAVTQLLKIKDPEAHPTSPASALPHARAPHEKREAPAVLTSNIDLHTAAFLDSAVVYETRDDCERALGARPRSELEQDHGGGRAAAGTSASACV
ncbi:hypothetical protein PsYK624_152910 [Phanerochaete sordida]|uniref:Uncharacterized protein n=1 Tax=Phanerochaete sordida TaxID=48140 RepID=A0A9P3GQ01_9APHY|nr:hypothetical protein PsYK624_152910 [Phanerochaete sordida]